MTINEKDQTEILRNIALTGAADTANASINHIIANKEQFAAITSFASGIPRIRKPFNLILSQPNELQPLSSFEVRCCSCGRIISYPAWYYVARYKVNQIHYFICFDGNNSDKPTAKCYRRTA